MGFRRERTDRQLNGLATLLYNVGVSLVADASD